MVDENNAILCNYLKEKKIKKFIRHAVLCKKNIVISGGTSTGKTTFTNAALGEIPTHERLITVEDAREVQLHNQIKQRFFCKFTFYLLNITHSYLNN